MVRALFCLALVACRANSARGPADSRPSVAITDGATPADSPMLDGATPADSLMLDGATPADSPPLVDAPVVSDATVLVDGSVAIEGAVLVDAATANTVSCFALAAPNTTCTLPTHCCFSNYDSQHQGDCTSATCGWGTISCDGPEDCASGERCCAHALIDPDQGLTGYALACQATACGPAPANQELCHPGTCSSGTCVSVVGNDSDLPRTLRICQ